MPLRPALPALLSLTLLLAVAACDSAAPPTGDDPGVSPGTPQPVALGADFPEGRADFGAFPSYYFDASVSFGGPGTEGRVLSLGTSTLLLTGTQDGQPRYAGGSSPLDVNTAPCADIDFRSPAPFFRLASGVAYSVGEWPVELGAPLTDAGAPRVYGDLMAWNAYCTGYDTVDGNREVAPSADILQDLRINLAVFQYERADIAGARFLRYEVTNLGDAPITDLRAALFTDPDVGGIGDGQHYRRNLMGSADDYAFVYTSDAVGEAYRGAAVALGLLETPKGVGEAARRIMYRDHGPAPDQAAFSNLTFFQATIPTVFHALRGLDDNGDPVVNPVTGATTSRMYDGDPVAGTGWLDGTLPNGGDGWDVRVFQSTEPFTLAPGETVVLTALGVAAVGADRAAGLASVDAQFQAVAADPSLWRFPIASD